MLNLNRCRRDEDHGIVEGPAMTVKQVMLVSGAAISAYAAYALYSGSVISTWGQFANRPGAVYWVTVSLLMLLGLANLWTAIRM